MPPNHTIVGINQIYKLRNYVGSSGSGSTSVSVPESDPEFRTKHEEARNFLLALWCTGKDMKCDISKYQRCSNKTDDATVK